MLREYEFTIIASSQISDDESRKLLEKYEGVLFEKGGEVIRKSDWGMKKLAFPIKTQHRGRYTHYDLLTTPDCLAEAERLMRIDDHVLRYLSVKIGENVNPDERRRQLAKKEAQQALREEKEKKIIS